MTNEPAQFLPLTNFGGFSFLTAGTQPSEKGVAPAQRNTLRLWNQEKDPANIGRGEITIYGFSQQGLNHPEGDFSQTSNGLSRSDFVTLRDGELVPPPNTLTLSDSSIASTVGFHTAYALSTLFMGAGSAANHALYKETSSTDPTPIAITYSPSGSISSLTRILISAGERLLVGHVGAAAKIISTNTGTVETTMDATTASLWGAIVSGTNFDSAKAGIPQLLMYYGTNIGYKSADSVMTAAPTNTHTVPAGGFAIGAIKPGGRAQWAYWGIPQVSNASGALASGAYCDVYATPMDGGADFLPVTLRTMPNGIKGAIPFRDGFACWDDTHVSYWDGDHDYDLAIFKQRAGGLTANDAVPRLNHDYPRIIKGVFTDGVTVGAIHQAYDNGGLSAALPTYTFCEMYNYESGSWHNIGAPFSSPTADLGYLCNGSVISPSGLRVWFLSDTAETIHGFFVPRAYESLLWNVSLGAGSVTNTAMPTFLTTPTLLGPRWRIDADPPGYIKSTSSIARTPKVIYEVEFNGNLGTDYEGSEQWKFTVQVQGLDLAGALQTAYNQTFSSGQNPSHYLRKNPVTARTSIQDVQLYLSASNVTSNMRALAKFTPFVVRFAYSKDGTPITALPED